MSRGGFERAANLAQAARAIADIIRAGLASGWAGAAVAALKHYWPKILPIAIAIILLPVIMIFSLPAILLPFSGTPQAQRAERMMAHYERYDVYRNAQLEEIINEQRLPNENFSIEYVNDSFDIHWLIAIHSVLHENDLNRLTVENLKELIKKTYTYEIIEVEPEEYEESEEETEPDSTDESTEPTEPTQKKIIRVTTLNASAVMRSLNFDNEQIMWATLIYETHSSGQDDMPTNEYNSGIFDLIREDDTPHIGGDFASPFPNVRWQDYVSSEFGRRTHPVTGVPQSNHTGIDVALPHGADIHAVQGGTVLFVRDSGNSGYGLHLAINHGGGVVTLYAHCSEILVRQNQRVNQGDVIARVGSTGMSTGPHLHLEFIINGVPRNPRLFLPR